MHSEFLRRPMLVLMHAVADLAGKRFPCLISLFLFPYSMLVRESHNLKTFFYRYDYLDIYCMHRSYLLNLWKECWLELSYYLDKYKFNLWQNLVFMIYRLNLRIFISLPYYIFCNFSIVNVLPSLYHCNSIGETDSNEIWIQKIFTVRFYVFQRLFSICCTTH